LRLLPTVSASLLQHSPSRLPWLRRRSRNWLFSGAPLRGDIEITATARWRHVAGRLGDAASILADRRLGMLATFRACWQAGDNGMAAFGRRGGGRRRKTKRTAKAGM